MVANRRSNVQRSDYARTRHDGNLPRARSFFPSTEGDIDVAVLLDDDHAANPTAIEDSIRRLAGGIGSTWLTSTTHRRCSTTA